MNRSDIVLLLTKAAAYDYRKVGDTDVEAWFEALHDLDLADALAAVVRHYRESTDRMMPAHVRAQVRLIREERRRLEPSEVRALPSPFEEDMGRRVRVAAGVAQARQALEPLLAHLAEQSGRAAGLSALEQLRELTPGPQWPTDGEVNP